MPTCYMSLFMFDNIYKTMLDALMCQYDSLTLGMSTCLLINRLMHAKTYQAVKAQKPVKVGDTSTH